MKRGLVAKIAALVVIVLLLNMPLQVGAAQEPSAATKVSAAKVVQLLTASGYTFKQLTPIVWTIDFTGKSLPNFKVLLSTQDDLLVIFVIAAEKKNIPLNTNFMFKLLRFNHSLDRVKVGLDDDGDLFVRVDLSVRILDVTDLKLNVEQVAASSNEVYAAIKGDLTS